MILPFVPRFILLIVQRSIERFIRCSCVIVDQLHVHLDHGCVVGQIPPDHSKHGKPADTSLPPYVDVFEKPYFVSTDYKDDRAAVNLANIASHAGTQAHVKNCECKSCRDRRPALPKGATGRRHGYKGAPIRTRTTAVDLDPSWQFVATPEQESQKSVANLRVGKSSPGLLPQRPRLRGGDLRNLISGSNRFASLPIERTKDEDDYHPNAKDLPGLYSTKALNSCSVGVREKSSDDSAEGSPVGLSLAQLTALLEYEVDSDLEDDDLDSSDTDDGSSPPAFPVTAHTKSVTPHPYTPATQAQPPCPIRTRESNTILSDTATDGGSQTADENSRLMPWEEDDWEERKVLGARALCWTRSRVLCRYRHGEGKLDWFEGEKVLCG